MWRERQVSVVPNGGTFEFAWTLSLSQTFEKVSRVEGREKREKESEIQRPATGAEPEFNDSTNRSSTLYPRERGNLKWREKERGRVGGERESARYFGVGRG